MKREIFASTSAEESARERAHRALARRMAAEGMVLLKNNGALPLTSSERSVSLFGFATKQPLYSCATGSGRTILSWRTRFPGFPGRSFRRR